ncbi:uncharacterized protein si:dkey-211g8.8 isoform X2 [Labeo rohita]|uniref:uncharacterized protein si:dkey-211g8.8 isoform X2 n=1 Tax=Labeo rohita TaxID=84645 RepID=UPI0021E24386|nr:uncharacterized protein si:dkey-211g8.8 isoform X2 [Labeo rohita]
MAERMRKRKRSAAAKDEGRSKECRTATETPLEHAMEKTCHNAHLPNHPHCNSVTSNKDDQESNLSSLKSLKRPNCPPEDETFYGKRQRNSDYSQPEDYKGSEIGSGLEVGGNTHSSCEGNENKATKQAMSFCHSSQSK